jgi:hypothetical protein
MMDKAKKTRQQTEKSVAEAEDVEFSRELADREDLQAQKRAKEADERVK